MIKKQRSNKYGAKKVRVDGRVFDSGLEYRRWLYLSDLEKNGVIKGLVHQVPFKLVVNGQDICKYKADFVYQRGPKGVVEDTKNEYLRKKDRTYLLKKKLMRAIYSVDIHEVDDKNWSVGG
ncbi:MAG: DUF1064 domain-containing protein [Betaproteobacteria bacterium]